ncbi:MAG: hypothetical protein JNM09_03190 [Blastocatellia bacterium]|nr:hypothetical protein [Blastocatellia bacterium]
MRIYWMIFVLILLLSNSMVLAQAQDDQRQLIPEEFIKARPKKAAAAVAPKTRYRLANSVEVKNTKDIQCADHHCRQLGLTLWRLRPGKDEDPARIIIHEGAETTTLTPERIAANTPLKYGEKIRLSFEAPHTGYLYVIDRELFSNGTTGTPHLIFPTLRIRGGDNAVAPGRLIEIPSQEDRPNFFTLQQSRIENVGELLTVIVAPHPLPGLTITERAQTLTLEQVTQWEQQWGGKMEQFEMMGGEGAAWTKVEQQAGAERTRDLTQNDPGPQTIFRVVVKPGTPLLVNVGLKYQRPKAKARNRK